ncbi:transposase, partial [Okeania hirsuta]
SQAAQQTLRTVAESFRSYYGLIIAYNEGKIEHRPRIPNYRKKGGMATLLKKINRLDFGQIN